MTEALFEALPATLLLAFVAMGLAMVLGITLGLWLAWRGDGKLAQWVIGLATLGMSAPSFSSRFWWLGCWDLYGTIGQAFRPPGWRVLHPLTVHKWPGTIWCCRR